ncbi:MAG: 3'(2'),5'-bisphosphate nucleotidase [Phycisphaerales bacterium]|nr:3'(2'),5'-bisphosphate nucleotidase [Phycisphaerales bacterium]
MNQQHSLLQAALSAVATGCGAAKHVQRELESVREVTKDDRSPVTVADFAVQALVWMSLNESLDAPLIVGEESADLLRNVNQAAVLDAVVSTVKSARSDVTTAQVLDAIDACNHDGTADSYWTLDPIDGTKGFLRQQQFAIALGYIEHGEVVLGVMGCPSLPVDHAAPLDTADSEGVLYAASKGAGAWEYPACDPQCTPRQVHANSWSAGQTTRTCESVESGHSKQDETAAVLKKLGSPSAPVRLDSQCKYALVARNQADAYLRMPTRKGYVEKIWDHAAGMIIATEAGALVSDVTGAPLDFTQGATLQNNRGVICAVPGLHESIIEIISALGVGAGA